MNEVIKFSPQNFSELMTFADMASKTELVPINFKGKPSDIVIACQMGAELGLQPMQSLQNIAVINGRPSIWGDAMLAIVSGHPDCQDIIEAFDDKTMTATCTVKRRNRADVISKFSKEDAILAGLWQGDRPKVKSKDKAGNFYETANSSPWYKYPKRMLQMRARGFALRDAFPDALRGIITREEAIDMPKANRIDPEYSDIQASNDGQILINAEQIEELKKAVQNSIGEEEFNAQMSKKGYKSIEDIPSENFQNIMNFLNSKAVKNG
jgi:hypothetical protein